MSNKPKPSAVIFAKNIASIAKFYQEVISMSIVLADQDHIVLDTEGFQLVVHGIPQQISETIEIATPPILRDQMLIKLCLPVSSIEESRTKASQFGGQINPKSKEWESRGFRACDGFDPEGNVIQIRESLN